MSQKLNSNIIPPKMLFLNDLTPPLWISLDYINLTNFIYDFVWNECLTFISKLLTNDFSMLYPGQYVILHHCGKGMIIFTLSSHFKGDLLAWYMSSYSNRPLCKTDKFLLPYNYQVWLLCLYAWKHILSAMLHGINLSAAQNLNIGHSF